MRRSPAGREGGKWKRLGWGALVAGAFSAGLLLVGAALFWPAADVSLPPKASPFGGPEARLSPGGNGNAGIDAGDPDMGDAGREPMLAIVVGDLGYDPAGDGEWLDFPVRVTFAVLPFGPSSRAVASSAPSRGHCVILHVPMEPASPVSDRTEPFRLRVGMSRAEIGERVSRMAEEIPQAVGAMNHMGSAFTADPASMAAFVAVLKERRYFFVDGVTAAGSLGLEASENAGVAAVRRDVFFDDDPAPGAMRRRWEKALARARAAGGAILVCHPRRETLNTLRELLPELREKGIRPVTVPELLERRLPPGKPAGEG